MAKYALGIQYDGTDFAGWQYQPGLRTVQQELFEAMKRVLGGKQEIVVAGRTDRGVHAEGQVAHLRTRRAVAPESTRVALNDALPKSIHIYGLVRVSHRFHARFSARSRQYRYQLTVSHSPFLRRFAWRIPPLVDLDRLRRAIAMVEGTHEFHRFQRKTPVGKSRRCMIEETSVECIDERRVWIRFRGDRFLRNMVRLIVGGAVDVAAGSIELEQFQGLLHCANVAGTPTLAPAHGLFLERVAYDELELPAPPAGPGG